MKSIDKLAQVLC